VLAGFKAGTGLLIAVGQLGKVLGIPQTGDHFVDKLWSAVKDLGAIDWPTAAIAGASVALLLALKRWAPRSVPGALIVVAGGIVIGKAGAGGVDLVGPVPSGLPGPVAPQFDLIGPLLPAAAGVALMSFVESIATGRAVARVGEREPDADQELRALGVANLAGGVFQAFPAGGASRRRRSTTTRGRRWRARSPACSPCSRCCSSPGCSPTCGRRRSARWCSSRRSACSTASWSACWCRC
jgi:SulP family sulfate permease